MERTEQTQQFIKNASFWSWANTLARICGYRLHLHNLVSFIYVGTSGACFGYWFGFFRAQLSWYCKRVVGLVMK